MSGSKQYTLWRRWNSSHFRVVLTGFGKHPAWAEHQKGIGGSSAALADLRKLLYLDGITTCLSRWEELPSVKRQPYDHWLLWVRPREFILARILSSSDRVGRSAFPFVVAAEVSGVDLATMVRCVAPRLDVLGKRCLGLGDEVGVGAAFAQELRALHEIAPGASGPVPDERNQFVSLFGLIASCGDQPLARFLDRAERQRLWDGGVLARLPALSGNIAGTVLLWEEFVRTRVKPNGPRFYVGPAEGDWVDLILGKVEGHHFHGLQVNRIGMERDTDRIPSEAPAERLQLEAAGILAAWRVGMEAVNDNAGSSQNLRQAKDTSHWLKRMAVVVPVLLVLAGAIWALTRPPSHQTLSQRANQAWEASDFDLALHVYKEMVRQHPNDQLALARIRSIETPPAAKRGLPLVVEAGREVPLSVEADDVLGRDVDLAFASQQIIGGDRVEARGGKWFYLSDAHANGVVRTNRVEFVLANGQARATGSLEVVVTPSHAGVLADETRRLLKHGDFPAALTMCREWVQALGTNATAEALGLLRDLESPPEVTLTAPVKLTAGEIKDIALTVRDGLNRPLIIRPTVVPSGFADRVEQRGSKWLYMAQLGEARMGYVDFLIGNGQASTNFRVAVLVQADAATKLSAEAAGLLSSNRFAEAFGKYQELARTVPGNPVAASQIARFLTLPRITMPGILEVNAGEPIHFEFKVNDDLGRAVNIMPASGGDGSGVGRLEPIQGTDARGWAFTPASDASGEVQLSFLASNGQTSAVVPVRIMIGRDPANEHLAAAEAAWGKGNWKSALTEYQQVLRLNPAQKVALARVRLLTNPPTLKVDPPGEARPGETLRGTVQVIPDEPVSPVPWRVEVATDEIKSGTFVFTAEDRRWSWSAPAGIAAAGTVKFRAATETGHSGWTNLELISRLALPPVFSRLPDRPVQMPLGAGSQVEFEFDLRHNGNSAPLVTGSGQAGAPAVSLANSGKHTWRILLTEAQRTGHFEYMLRADNRDGSTTNGFLVTVTQGANPSSTIGLAPDASITNLSAWLQRDFVWIPSDLGQVWPGAVERARGFWVCRYETSVAEFSTLISSPSTVAREKSISLPEMPVGSVSETEVYDYLRNLNIQYQGQLDIPWHFRLPTRQEWWLYSGMGEIPADSVLNADGARSVRVGGTNRLGVAHAVGNVAELSSERHQGRIRVMGFSFRDEPQLVDRGSSSLMREPAEYIGFRVVLACPPPKNGSP